MAVFTLILTRRGNAVLQLRLIESLVVWPCVISLLVWFLWYSLIFINVAHGQCETFRHYARGTTYPNSKESIREDRGFLELSIDTSNGSESDEFARWKWQVDGSYKLMKFQLYSMETGDLFLNCSYASQDPIGPCCELPSNPHANSSFPKECTDAIYVVNSQQQNYELVYGNRHHPEVFVNVIAHIHMNRPEGLKVFTRASLAEGFHTCGELAKTNPWRGKLPDNDTLEREYHFVNQSLWQTLLITDNTLKLIFHGWTVHKMGVRVFLYSVHKYSRHALDIRRQELYAASKTPIVPLDGSHYTERVQTTESFSKYFRSITIKLNVGYSSRALLVTSGLVTNKDMAMIDGVVYDLLRGRQAQTRWPTKSPPGIRLYRVLKDCEYGVVKPYGSRIEFELDEGYYVNYPECFVSHFNGEGFVKLSSSTDFEMYGIGARNVIISSCHPAHSALYTCSFGGKNYFVGLPIICLPRQADYQQYVLSVSNDRKVQWKDAFKYHDFSGTPYIPEGAQVVITCNKVIGQRMDNYGEESLFHTVADTSEPLPFEHVRRTITRLEYNNGAHSYYYMAEIYHIWSVNRMGKLTRHHVVCRFRYRQIPELVRHLPQEDWQITLTANRTKLISAYGKKPLIVADHCRYSDSSVQSILRRPEAADPKLAGFTTLLRPSGRTEEGIYNGSFITFHALLVANISVWTVDRETRSKLIRHECSMSSIQISRKQHGYLTKTVEFKSAQTLVASIVQFSCVLNVHTVGVVLNVQHCHANTTDSEVIRRLYTQSLLRVVQHRLQNISASNLSFIHDPVGSSSAFRFSRVSLGWRATLKVGQRISLIKSVVRVNCSYRLEANHTLSVIPEGYSERQLGKLLEIFHLNALHEHSGLYICTIGGRESTTRRLAVLPEPSQLSIKIQYEHILSQNNKIPNVLSAQPINVTCSVWLHVGFVVGPIFVVDFISVFNGNKTISLPVKTAAQQPGITRQSEKYVAVQHFEVIAPNPVDCGKVSRITCRLVLRDFERDVSDLSEIPSEIELKQSVEINVTERLQPQIIFRMSASDCVALRNGMKDSRSTNATQMLMRKRSAPNETKETVFVEEVCRLEYIAFYGIPEGQLLIWLVRRTTTNTLKLDECLTKNTSVLGSALYQNLPIYRESKARYGFKAECVTAFLPEHVGMFAVVLNAYDYTRSVTEEQRAIKPVVRGWFERYYGLKSSTQKEAELLWDSFRTKPQYHIVRFRVYRQAIIRAGDAIKILGLKEPQAAIKFECRFQSADSSLEVAVSKRFELQRTRYPGSFLLHAKTSYLSDSGSYKCLNKSCPGCPVEDVFPPRNIIVLPNDFMLGLDLSYRKLRINDTIAHPAQVPNLSAAYPDQLVNVRCTHRVSSIKKLQPKVILNTEEIRNRRKTVSEEPDLVFDFMHRSTSGTEMYRVFSFTFTTALPEAKYNLTCVFQFENVTVTQVDHNGSFIPPMFTKSATIKVNGTLSPVIFNRHLQSKPTQLMDNLNHQGESEISSVMFHQTGSKHRLEETNAQLFIVYHRGYPTGHLRVWSFYNIEEEPQVYAEDCYVLSDVSLDEVEVEALPTDIRDHARHSLSAGAGYKNASFVCTLQIHHIAIVAFVCQKKVQHSGRQHDNCFLTARQSLVHHISSFLVNPVSDKQRSVPVPEDYAYTFRIQKVKLGWYGSVYPNETWQMLLSYSALKEDSPSDKPSRQVRYFKIYFQTPGSTHASLVEQRITDSLEYYTSNRSTYSDSGFYYAEVTRCINGCPVLRIAHRRKLMVIPQPDILSACLLDRRFSSVDSELIQACSQSIATVDSSALFYLEKYYIYCVMKVVPAWESLYSLDFELTEGTTRGIRNFPHLKLASLTSAKGFVILLFQVIGPDPIEHPGPLNATCKVTFRESDFFEDVDLRTPKRVEPISKSVLIPVNHTSAPILFVQSAQSIQSELQSAIQKSAVRPSHSAVRFHSSGAGMTHKIHESLLTVSQIIYLGVPTGRIFIRLYFQSQHNNKLFAEQKQACETIMTKHLSLVEIPGTLKLRQPYTDSNGIGYINHSFSCAIRAEHVALAMVVYNVHSTNRNLSTLDHELRMTSKIGETIQYWMDQPASDASSKVLPWTDILASYSIIRLHVGWNASVAVGSLVNMIGTVPVGAHNLYCFYGQDTKWINVTGRFQLLRTDLKHTYHFQLSKVVFADSGIYGCNGTQSGLSFVIFGPRMLVVLPNQYPVSVLLNERPLGPRDAWVDDQLTLVGNRSVAIVFSDSPIFLHCLIDLASSSVWESKPGFQFSTAEEDYQLKHRSFSIHRNITHELHPHLIHIPKAFQLSGLIRVSCTVSYTLQIVNPYDLNEPVSYVQKKAELILSIKAAVRPNLFTEFFQSDMPALRASFRTIKKQAETATEFHKTQFEPPQLEKIVRFSLLASLGFPRGKVTAWSLFKHSKNGRLLVGECDLTHIQPIIGSSVPDALRTDDAYRKSEWRNFVNTSFLCVLRPEHLSVIILAYTAPKDVLENVHTVQSIRSNLNKNVRRWLFHPTDRTKLDFYCPFNTLATYRVSKVNIGWQASVTSGSSVFMLGSGVGKEDQTKMDCFYQPNASYAPVPISKGWFNDSVQIGKRKYLWLKNSQVDCRDSGIYQCRLKMLDTVNGLNFSVGFEPRRLFVKPDHSLIRVLVTREQPVLSQDRLFDQATDGTKPATVPTNSAIYLTCFYSHLHAHPTQLRHRFTCGMLSEKTADLSPITSESVGKEASQTLHGETRYLKTWKISIPSSGDVLGPVQATCYVDYFNVTPPKNDINQAELEYTIKVHQIVTVEFRISSVLFERYIRMSNPVLENMIRRQSAGSVKSALDFFKSGPTQCVLEGLLHVDILSALGKPRGNIYVYVLYTHRNQTRMAECTQLSVRNLTKRDIPYDVQQSSFYKDARGENFIRISTVCPLTPIHIGLLVISMTIFSPGVTPQVVRHTFLSSLRKHIDQWLARPSSSTRTEFDSVTDTSIDYRLMHLCARSRVTVLVSSPIVVFGLLGPGGDGKPQCYHQGAVVLLGGPGNKQQRTLVAVDEADRNRSTFRIYTNRTTATFELIKLDADPTDAGFYQCYVEQCPQCGVHQRAVAKLRQVIVLQNPLVMRLNLSISFSERLTGDLLTTSQEPEDTGLVKILSLTVYPKQRLTASCQFQSLALDWMRPVVQISHRHRSEKLRNKSLHVSFLRERNTVDLKPDRIDLVSIDHEILVPSKTNEAIDHYEVACHFNVSHLTSKDDINTMKNFVTLDFIAILIVAELYHPAIKEDSVTTFHKALTERLQSPAATQSTHWRLLLQQTELLELIPEGPLRGKYLVELGSPMGWTGAWLIYNYSKTIEKDVCHTTIRSLFSPDSANPKVEGPNWQRVDFVCPLSLDHRAILVYAMHTLKTGNSVDEYEHHLLTTLQSTIGGWLGFADKLNMNGTGDNVTFGSCCTGVYRFSWLRVGWHASVPLGTPIRMYGRLSTSMGKLPSCTYATSLRQFEVDSKFKLRSSRTMAYFELFKEVADFADTGYYTCNSSDHQNKDRVIGFPRRHLVVLPDHSLVKLLLHPIQNPILHCIVRSGDPTKKRFTYSCIYPVAKGAERSAASIISHMKEYPSPADQLRFKPKRVSTHYEEHHGFRNVNKTFVIELPTVVEEVRRWHVACEVKYSKICVEFDMVDCIPHQKFTKTRSISIIMERKPRILSNTINTSPTFLTKYLRIPSTLYSNDLAVKSEWQSNDELIPEGQIQVAFEADVGDPQGWVLVWLVYESDGVLYQDTCPSVTIDGRSQMQEVKAHCLVQFSHVALFIAAIQDPTEEQAEHSVEAGVRQQLLANMSRWFLDLASSNKAREQANSYCSGIDYRIAPIHVRWLGVVQSGNPVQMFGRRDEGGIDGLVCYHSTQVQESDTGTLIPLHFRLESDNATMQFQVRTEHVQDTDTGYYHCTSVDRRRVYDSVGLLRRYLHVLPQVHCNLTVVDTGVDKGYAPKTLPNGTIYVFSSQLIHLQCIFSQSRVSPYYATYNLQYDAFDRQTGTWKPVAHPKNCTVLSQVDGENQTIIIFSVPVLRAKDDAPAMRISCVATYEIEETRVASVRVKKHNASCSQILVIFEPANGELEIKTLTKSFPSRPVPIGSRFECTGGYGLPSLEYRWIRQRSPSYSVDGTSNVPEEYASLLPTDFGGWGGPDKPMLDMPEHGLLVDGAILQVPLDPTYRGMSYLYTCYGTNEIMGTVYSINKTIHLTVSMCLTSRVKLDLTVETSPKLLSCCAISPNPDPEIQFYGYYFLSFVRQIVLSLPIEWDRVRISVLRDDVAEPAANDGGKHYSKSISLSQNLPRTELAKWLYSKENKPKTDRTVCSSLPMSLEQIVIALNRLNPVKQKSAHLVLLTFDSLVSVNLSRNGMRTLAEIHRTKKLQFVLSWVHANNKKFAPLEVRVNKLLKPIKVAHILPQFQGTNQYDTCNFPLNSNELKIRRSDVFKVICERGHVQSPKNLTTPLIFTSVPENQWIRGTNVYVSCITNHTNVTYAGFRYLSQLTLCLTDSTTLNRLINRTMKTNATVQQLEDICVMKLSRTNPADDSVVFSNMITVVGRVRINGGDAQNTSNYQLTLCYERLGEVDPELFDATIYSTLPLRPAEVTIGAPNLTLLWWSGLRERVAVFQCTFSGFVSDLEAVLLFRLTKNAADESYRIGARATPRLFGPLFTEGVSRLLWLEPATQEEYVDFCCLVWPKSVAIFTNRINLAEIPFQLSSVNIGCTINHTRLDSDCPVSPTITLDPDLNETHLQSKPDILRAACTLPATTLAVPLKMYFLSSERFAGLCNTGSWDMRGNEAVTIPCQVAGEEDTNCTQLVPRNDLSGHTTDYSFTCSMSRQPGSHHWFRHIELSIDEVTYRDLNGRLFCEALPDPAVLPSGYPRLTSPVKKVIYRIPPTIDRFIYNSEGEIWECFGFEYPTSETKRIEVVKASPVERAERMKTFRSASSKFTVPLKGATQLPRNSAKFNVAHNWNVTLTPRPAILPVFEESIVTLRCIFGKEHKELTITMPSMKPPVQAGGRETINCLLQHEVGDPIRQIVLQRRLQSSWLDYTVTVGTISTIYWTGNDWFLVAEEELQLRAFGPWMYSSPQVRLAIEHFSNRMVASVTVIGTSEFDSGDFYCTGSTIRGVHVHQDPFAIFLLGNQNDFVIAQRLVQRENLWSTSLPVVLVEDVIQTRCTLWTTNPEYRSPSIFQLIPLDLPVHYNRTIHSQAQRTSLIVRTADQYHMAMSDPTPNETRKWVGCRVQQSDAPMKEKWIAHPLVTCESPQELYWEPQSHTSYTRSVRLQCRSTGGCANLRYWWEWIAGPLPQVTLDAAEWSNVTYACHNEYLLLDRLPRAGPYVFRCVASCSCGETHLINKVTVTFFLVEDDQTDDIFEGLANKTRVGSPADHDETDIETKGPSDPLTEDVEERKTDIVEDFEEKEPKTVAIGPEWPHYCRQTAEGDYLCIADELDQLESSKPDLLDDWALPSLPTEADSQKWDRKPKYAVDRVKKSKYIMDETLLLQLYEQYTLNRRDDYRLVLEHRKHRLLDQSIALRPDTYRPAYRETFRLLDDIQAEWGGKRTEMSERLTKLKKPNKTVCLDFEENKILCTDMIVSETGKLLEERELVEYPLCDAHCRRLRLHDSINGSPSAFPEFQAETDYLTSPKEGQKLSQRMQTMDLSWPMEKSGRETEVLGANERRPGNHYQMHGRSSRKAMSSVSNKVELSDKIDFTEVRIVPPIVVLPGTATVLCPEFPYRKTSSNFRPVRMYWRHARSLNDLHNQEIVCEISLLVRDTRSGSPRYKNPDRVFAYPPHRWSSAYTLDIKPLDMEDYGFYGCTTTVMSSRPDSGYLNFTRVSPVPLCVIPETKDVNPPSLYLAGEHGVLQELPREMKPVDASSCLAAGTPILIRCESVPMQMFCERKDMLNFGQRLIRTELTANIRFIAEGQPSRTMTLSEGHEVSESKIADSEDESLDAHEQMALPKVIREWFVRLTPEFGGAQLSCTARPQLTNTHMLPFSTYWLWLVNQFVKSKIGLKSARQSPFSSSLCVIPKRGQLVIRPKLVISEAHPIGIVVAKVGHTVQCSVGYAGITHPLIQVYRIQQSQLKQMFTRSRHEFLQSLARPLNWPKQETPYFARLFIAKEAQAGETYYVRCFIEQEHMETDFIIEIQATLEKLGSGSLSILTPCLAIGLTALVLMEISVCWCWLVSRRRRLLFSQVDDLELGLALSK
ncbi:hypothetical protein CSKR_104607 [Clonorchis sinensis]|uniref:Ig-like domain-containing protein n=1 Tax=Clonorchis sinensis TaxID=79923 RepID=A0A419PLW1_CLOSI|nr:hypothetical protein CSKR_104607 [Clonorchis sinensis]